MTISDKFGFKLLYKGNFAVKRVEVNSKAVSTSSILTQKENMYLSFCV